MFQVVLSILLVTSVQVLTQPTWSVKGVSRNVEQELIDLKRSFLLLTVQMEDKLQEANGKMEELQKQVEQSDGKITEVVSDIHRLTDQSAVNWTQAEVKQVQLSEDVERCREELKNIASDVKFLLGMVVTSPEPMETTTDDFNCIESPGPVGDPVGQIFSDELLSYQGRVSKVLIWSGTFVDCISLTYGTVDGPCHGGISGDAYSTDLQAGEHITGISGTFTTWDTFQQLTIVTNQRSLGVYGSDHNGDAFSLTSDGKPLAYISGYADNDLLRQLTAHFYC